MATETAATTTTDPVATHEMTTLFDDEGDTLDEDVTVYEDVYDPDEVGILVELVGGSGDGSGRTETLKPKNLSLLYFDVTYTLSG